VFREQVERWLCIKDEGESETADEPVGGAKLALTPALQLVALKEDYIRD